MKLDRRDHSSLALWAADCARWALSYFEGERPGDDRPRRAIVAGRAWARGETKVGEARAAAIASHSAAREADRSAARYAARAAGHAAASAAASAAPDDALAGERDLKYRCLPEHLRPAVFPGR